MAGVTLDEVTKIYHDGTLAVSDLGLEIADGEFMVLVGPSGCGKTTALRMVAGLESITEGHVRIGERVVDRLPPKDRDIAMVFQNYALYPHLSVADNLAFSLKLHKVGRDEVRRRVAEAAHILGLEEFLERKPRNLSGGQRQRVAMGRAIVREPSAFLMDEPLSNLDAKLRVGVRASLAELHRRLGVTTVYVTHDQTEAMTLGQRVAVLREGRILQTDRPQKLYEEPKDLFVAAFIGSPAMNLVEARIDGRELVFGQYRVPLDAERRRPAGTSRNVILGIRPETFEDASFAPRELPTVEVEVTVLEELGADAHVFFRVDAPQVTAEALEGKEDATLIADSTALFSARVDPRTRARVGDRVLLAVDPSRFHFFDSETGSSLLLEPRHAAVAVAGA